VLPQYPWQATRCERSSVSGVQRRGRLTYRALKRQCNIDDAYFEDLQAELMQGQRLPELWQRSLSHGGNVAYQGCRRRMGRC
jgi:hypothetical protein